MNATEVTAGLAESNGSLLLGLWRDSLHVTCGLTACTPGSAPGPTLGNEYGKTLPFTLHVNGYSKAIGRVRLFVCVLLLADISATVRSNTISSSNEIYIAPVFSEAAQ